MEEAVLGTFGLTGGDLSVRGGGSGFPTDMDLY